MVIPLVEDRYQMYAMGRLQLTDTQHNAAVAAIDPATLRPVIETITSNEEGVFKWEDAKVTAVRERVMAAVEPLMFI